MGCIRDTSTEKRTRRVGKKNRDILLSPVQVHMHRPRAEIGSWMGSMQMAGRMKRVEVIGIGGLYKCRVKAPT